jgi:hypothetical protein
MGTGRHTVLLGHVRLFLQQTYFLCPKHARNKRIYLLSLATDASCHRGPSADWALNNIPNSLSRCHTATSVESTCFIAPSTVHLRAACAQAQAFRRALVGEHFRWHPCNARPVGSGVPLLASAKVFRCLRLPKLQQLLRVSDLVHN